MKPLATARTLWLGILVFTVVPVIFAVVVPLPILRAPPPPVMARALAVVAATVAVMSFVLPALTLRQAIRRSPPPIVEEAEPRPAGEYRSAQPRRRVIRVDDTVFASLVVKYQAPFILSIALSESVSLFGLVLDRLGFEAWQSAPFFAVGTLLVLVRFPTRRAVLSPVERALGVPAVDASSPT